MAKAIIGITDWTQTRSNLAALARRVDAGERLPEADYMLNFASPVALLEALPPKRLEALRTIRKVGPISIYALAKKLCRNYSNIHSDVMRLLDLGLVEKDEHGRICVPWDDVVVRVDGSLMVAA
ncbi:MAG: hypothetical protein BGP21_04710 [Thiobacillus sp. 65-29]|nr:MAG: hypothetical protein BGP21_04710 [Thiobacillus sp. 65-29]